MPYRLRIGARIGSADPYWVQTREAVLQHAQHLDVDLIPIDIGSPATLAESEHITFVEELLAHDLDALICTYLPETLTQRILAAGLPVIQMTETDLCHPLFVSPRGFYTIGQMAATYVCEQLGGQGQVLVVGGLLAPSGEDGRSRIAGIYEALRGNARIGLRHIPSTWRYERAYPQIEAGMRAYGRRIDAIIGLSDSLALAARDAATALQLSDRQTVIVGINGDPLALAAIADGRMAATVDTPAAEFGFQAVTLACRAARHEPLPAHFGYGPRLVTAHNVAEIAMQKLIAIAELPSRLVGVNRQHEQQRLAQLELSLEINRRVGSILNRQQLLHEIAELIRAGYGYDTVRVCVWLEQEHGFLVEGEAPERVPLDEAGMLATALAQNELIFVPDTQRSHRYPPDPLWPATRSRVIVPFRFGDTILGLLDLHSQVAMQHTRQSLAGLQLLADELGIALRNADLYTEAVHARAGAEKADLLKTRLLANVSHELRTPLNVILGYSQSALGVPNPYNATLPPALLQDLRHIYRSGEHLIHLINDLLDLSRAEIDELDLFPELIATHSFLREVFQSVAHGLDTPDGVSYRLALPAQLPMLQADPVRLRQILLNLLSNARKFTVAGEITLGAEVVPPHIHIWVKDTGAGIPANLQEQIFEPFVTGSPGHSRAEGVGLGLSITRRLVALHRGTITLESAPGAGSTFHVYVPLPGLNGQASTGFADDTPALLLISANATPPAAITDLSERHGLEIRHVRRPADLHEYVEQCRPVALAWDLAEAHAIDWALIQQLRADPRLCHLPFVVYGAETTGDGPTGATGLVSKPLHGKTLLDALDALRPADALGPVLIVDDDARVREVYHALVAQALPGYAIHLADSGAAALDLLERVVPSLVLLDLSMPGIDGFAVLRHIRADDRVRHVPVLVISGRTLSFDDAGQLDHALVTFHSKDLLSADEARLALHAALTRETALAQPTSRIVKHAIAYIHQNHMRDLSRQEIAEAVGVSKNYLTQIFHQELGLSPWEYLNRYRIAQAKTLLRCTGDTITAVAGRVGFDDVSYFGRVFRKQVGCSPQTYREQL